MRSNTEGLDKLSLPDGQHWRVGRVTRGLVCVPVHPKGAGRGWGQGSVQASQVLSVPGFVHGGRCHSSPNCCLEVGSLVLSKISLYAAALTFPWTRTKLALKNNPRPKVHKSMQGLSVPTQAYNLLGNSRQSHLVVWETHKTNVHTASKIQKWEACKLQGVWILSCVQQVITKPISAWWHSPPLFPAHLITAKRMYDDNNQCHLLGWMRRILTHCISWRSENSQLTPL